MNNLNIKKCFKNFNNCSGWRSIIKFLEYCEKFESKQNYKQLMKLYEEFKELDNFGLIKNFVNFQKYCLSK